MRAWQIAARRFDPAYFGSCEGLYPDEAECTRSKRLGTEGILNTPRTQDFHGSSEDGP
jgi:hypothetical protein